MEKAAVKNKKFCIAAIFLAIMSLMMLVGYVSFLVGLVEFLKKGRYFIEKKDFIKQYVLEIMSIIPILSYVFFSIVLFMQKRGRLLGFAIALVVALQLLIGGAYFFVSYSIWYDYAVGAGIGLSNFVIALLVICILSKLNLSKRVRAWLLALVINTYIIFYFSNIIYNITMIDFHNKIEVGVLLEQVFWVVFTTLSLVFMAKWIFIDDEKEPVQSACEEQSESVFVKSSKSNTAMAKEIRGLKALMDEGLITEEEFAEKKRRILGL